MTTLRQRMVEELQRRNYSSSTIRGYVLAVKQFADYFGKPPDRLGATHVQRFQWYLLQERKLNPGTVEMRMSALRFFFKKMLKRRDMHFDDLPFPKTPRKLPTVLSPEEVRRMIDGTRNLMHRTLLMVLYGTGVRRKELSLLKVADIDSKRMVVHIRQGKGLTRSGYSPQSETARSPTRVLALEKTAGLSVSKYRRSSWCGSTDVGQGRLVGCAGSGPPRRHHAQDWSPLVSTFICHRVARNRYGSSSDSASDGARALGRHGSLSAPIAASSED